MTTCAIMQPTYFPWAGYFNLIQSVDNFVILDDVQCERQSWQTRNQVLIHGAKQYINLPISRSHTLETPIYNIKLADNIIFWQKKAFKTLVAAYQKCPYGREFLGDISPFFHEEKYLLLSLANYNIEIINFLCKKMEISKSFYSSSQFDISGKRTEYLIKIITHLGCNHYLSPQGSREYLLEDNFESNKDISLSFQSFTPREYQQPGANEFISHLSIIDVIANLGYQQAKEYCQ